MLNQFPPHHNQGSAPPPPHLPPHLGNLANNQGVTNSPYGSNSQLFRGPPPQAYLDNSDYSEHHGYPSGRHHAFQQFSSASNSSNTLVPMEEGGILSNNNVPHGQLGEEFDSLPDSQSFETKCSLNVLRRREPLGASANKPEKKGASAGGGEGEVGHSGSMEEGGSSQQLQQQQQILMSRPSVEVVIPNEIGKTSYILLKMLALLLIKPSSNEFQRILNLGSQNESGREVFVLL